MRSEFADPELNMMDEAEVNGLLDQHIKPAVLSVD